MTTDLLLLSAAHFRRLAEGEDETEKELLLPPNKRQKEQAIDIKVNWIIDIDPKEFLKLTLDTEPGHYPRMDNIEPQPLETYKSPEYQADMRVHPMLLIDKDTGKIRAHEGRHRAAAVMQAGGKWYRIGVQFRGENGSDRNFRPENMPKTWRGNFSSYSVNIDDLLARGKMRIVDQHIQKQYYREPIKKGSLQKKAGITIHFRPGEVKDMVNTAIQLNGGEYRYNARGSSVYFSGRQFHDFLDWLNDWAESEYCEDENERASIKDTIRHIMSQLPVS